MKVAKEEQTITFKNIHYSLRNEGGTKDEKVLFELYA